MGTIISTDVVLYCIIPYMNNIDIVIHRRLNSIYMKIAFKYFSDNRSDFVNIWFRRACKFGYLEIVKELVKNDNIRFDENDLYPLRWAVKKGYDEIVHELVENCKKILRSAMLKGDFQERYKNIIYDLLKIDIPGKFYQKYKSPLIEAGGHGILKAVKIMMNKNYVVDKNYIYSKTLIEASGWGHTNVVLELLKYKYINIQMKRFLAVRKSVKYRHLDIMKILLADPRIKLDAYDNLLIRWASQHGHVETVKELLKYSTVNLNDVNNWAIIHAMYGRHVEIMKILLGKNTMKIHGFIGWRNKWNLHYQYMHTKCYKLILDDPNITGMR